MTVTSEGIRRIHVLVVDDSAFMRTALSRMINCEAEMEVVATACCASAAFEKISEFDPDVVTLDVRMPGLDGLDTLRCIMAQSPRPVIIVSAATENGGGATLEALSAGAFDCVPKQLSATSLEIAHIRQELISKIRTAAISYRGRSAHIGSKKPSQSALPANERLMSAGAAIVAIGISTGGPKALEQILPLFPENFSMPILFAQHMPVGFTAPLAKRLNSISSMKVTEALNGELIRPGRTYIAPAGVHLRVASRRSDSKPFMILESQPEEAPHRPSVDILMNSVAQLFKSRAIGVIMTGMGSDGAVGMTSIFRHGGVTIGQDESSCAVYGMPRVCAELGILTHELSLKEIPAHIVAAALRRRRA